MRFFIAFLLLCFFVGCGGASSEGEALDDSMSVPGQDGGEPVLAEEGP
jgi:hypothetical protein